VLPTPCKTDLIHQMEYAVHRNLRRKSVEKGDEKPTKIILRVFS